MLKPSPSWSLYRETFTKMVRREMKREGLNQKAFAKEIEIPESTLSLQLNKSLRPWFVDRVAEYWPDRFQDAPVEARRAMLGGVRPTAAEITHLRAMLFMFIQAKESAEEGIAYSRDLIADFESRLEGGLSEENH
jgi:hypothetical protein